MAEGPEVANADIKQDLLQYFEENHLAWREQHGHINVDLNVQTAERKLHILRVYFPGNFSNVRVEVAVVQPLDDGNPIRENETRFQRLGLRPDGCRKICFSLHAPLPSEARVVMNVIFMKVLLWLAAYEEHLTSSQGLRQCLEEFQRVIVTYRIITQWSSAQVIRLVREINRLDEYYRRNGIKLKLENKFIDVTITPANERCMYTLRVILPHDYPNFCPSLVIVHPPQLLQRNGEPIPSNSKDFHTLDRIDGHGQSICHYGQHEWLDFLTVAQVFKRGEIWINAYHNYMTGSEDVFDVVLSRASQCTEN